MQAYSSSVLKQLTLRMVFASMYASLVVEEQGSENVLYSMGLCC